MSFAFQNCVMLLLCIVHFNIFNLQRFDIGLVGHYKTLTSLIGKNLQHDICENVTWHVKVL